MEIFILYKFYIFFILKSYLKKKKKKAVPQTRTAEHPREGNGTRLWSQHTQCGRVQAG